MGRDHPTDHDNGPLEDGFPLPARGFQVPCWSSGGKKNIIEPP